jgi:hypothetical protein
VACTFTYGTWSGCQNNTQTRSYTASPVGCTGVPPSDSTFKPCNSTPLRLNLVSSYRGTIVVSATGGTSPYYFSINSKNRYTLNKTTFTGVTRNTYSNVRLKDSTGAVILLKVYMPNY